MPDITRYLWNLKYPHGSYIKLDMRLRNMDARQQSQYGKISKSQILTPPHPLGHVMSARCEQPLDELTVQVWLLNHHPKFNYCTFYWSGTELRTKTDWRTDDPITRCPSDLSGRGHKNALTLGKWPAEQLTHHQKKTNGKIGPPARRHWKREWKIIIFNIKTIFTNFGSEYCWILW